MRIIFIDEDYAFAMYDPEKLLIKIIWKGSQTSEQYRDTFMKAIDIAKEHHAKFFVSDVKKQRVVGPEDRKWFQEIAFPKAVEGGLRRAAVVFSGNVFKKYYLNNIFDSTKKFGVPLKFFSKMADAEGWLTENLSKDGE